MRPVGRKSASANLLPARLELFRRMAQVWILSRRELEFQAKTTNIPIKKTTQSISLGSNFLISRILLLSLHKKYVPAWPYKPSDNPHP